MPCFKPSKIDLLQKSNYLIDKYRVTGPFLEIGCGDGTFTESLASRKWEGVALDLSKEAISATSERLKSRNLTNSVEIIQTDFFEFTPQQKFGIIMMYDVLEHVERDRDMMARVRSMMVDNGYLLFSVPIKMKEWRWDDDGYGHIRRYEKHELDSLLNDPKQGFQIVVEWDITFPIIWLMRRIYTRLFTPPPTQNPIPIEMKTEKSAFSSAAGNGILRWIVESMPVWPGVFWLQDRFRDKWYGCNTLILARAV